MFQRLKNSADADVCLHDIYQRTADWMALPLADRLLHLSAIFLGQPYLTGALGEGPSGQFDQFPLYRTDAFDCLTFVNTVLALAVSENVLQFHQHLIKINYYHEKPRYQNRYHFMCVDWNIENAKWGIIRDITREVCDRAHLPLLIAEAMIDKPQWFLFRNDADIRLIAADTAKKNQRLKALHQLAETVQPTMGVVPYLPLHDLFSDAKKQQALLDGMVHGSLIEIVRPHWDLREKIGTYLNISHLGWVFWINNECIFRHASSLEKKVVDVPLLSYLHAHTVKGIHIYAIKKP